MIFHKPFFVLLFIILIKFIINKFIINNYFINIINNKTKITKGCDVLSDSRTTRFTVYNNITNQEKLALVNKDNIQLGEDWFEYLSSVDRSPKTIEQYKSDLNIFWVWNLENNDNKFFVDLNKRQISKFQNYAINTWKWSPNRIRRVKSALSSLSNYIENILDDEYEGYRPIIRKIENPALTTVREKTIISEEQLKYLLDKLIEQEKYQAACVVALAAYSGARKSELIQFKVSYFDDKNLIYNGSMYKTPENIRTKGKGKLGKQVPKYTLVAAKQYIDKWIKERNKLGIDSDWLFVTNIDGKCVQAGVSLIDNYMEQCSAILNVPVYAHMFRHFLVTEMVKKNIPTEVIQEFQKWSSDMVSVYNDNDVEADFSKYFSSDGIIQVDKGTLNNM